MDSGVPPVLPPVNPPPAAPRNSRTGRYVVLGLVVAAILWFLVVVGFGTIFALTAKDQPLSGHDKAALLTIADVALWMEDFSPDKSLETFSKKKYLDGSYDLNYEFDDPADRDTPYIMCSITVEPKVSDALISYKAVHVGLHIGFGAEEGVEQVERNDLFRWGDASKFCLLESEGLPVGVVFSARKETRVFLVSISGIYFDDSETIKELLEEKLRALERLPAP